MRAPTGVMTLYKVINGSQSQIGSLGLFPLNGSSAIKFKVYYDGSNDRFKVWKDGSLQINTTDASIYSGSVAFGGANANFDNLKIGYDSNNDDDLDDSGDDLAYDATFGGTSKSVTHDHAGNLIDDGTFRYVYDAPALDARQV